MFSMEQKKEFVLKSKIRAIIENLKIEAIKKEIEENKNNYSVKELEIFDNLLQESIENYNKDFETYTKGSIIFVIEELKQKHEDMD